MGNRVAALIWMLAAAVAAGGAAADPACREDTVWLRGEFGTARFSVDIADESAERARGLMFVERMARSRGMLFVYPDAAPRNFWMKNTLIPLDILFADETGTVLRVAAEAVPGDETQIPSGAPAQYVLEINGGLADRLGIGEGAEMRHPAIARAAWPCE
jgi:uncharacterized membrane protein (UPF0127 family)